MKSSGCMRRVLFTQLDAHQQVSRLMSSASLLTDLDGILATGWNRMDLSRHFFRVLIGLLPLCLMISPIAFWQVMVSYKTGMCERSSLMRLTSTFVVCSFIHMRMCLQSIDTWIHIESICYLPGVRREEIFTWALSEWFELFWSSIVRRELNKPQACVNTSIKADEIRHEWWATSTFRWCALSSICVCAFNRLTHGFILSPLWWWLVDEMIVCYLPGVRREEIFTWALSEWFELFWSSIVRRELKVRHRLDLPSVDSDADDFFLFVQVKNHINVICVRKPFRLLRRWTLIVAFIRVKSLINVIFVTNDSLPHRISTITNWHTAKWVNRWSFVCE